MNRYPLWVYVTVAVAIVLGFLYTLPNFFGESPAVQVSSAKATLKVDQGTLARVEEALKQANVTYTGLFLDSVGVKVRLPDTDTQLRAKDVLNQALNPDPQNPSYTVALNLLAASPNWLTAIRALPMYLGLDLRGGVHFLLQVDMKGALTKRLDAFAGDIRTTLRDKNIRHSGVSREGMSILVRFRDAETRERAKRAIADAVPDLQLAEAGDAPELRLVATIKPEAVTRIQDTAIKQNIGTLANRVNELGVAEPVIQQQGADRIVVQLPGVQDTARAKDILGRTATLELRMVEAHMSDPRARDFDAEKVQQAIAGNVPLGTELFINRRERGDEHLLLSKQVIVTGDRLTNAAATFDQDQRPAVSIELDAQGGRIMRDVTREGVKRRMAILLVEKGKPEVITAPVIQSEFGGRFQITGLLTSAEANDIALLLRAGSLAAPMEIVEERTVGPSLGQENIEKGFHSTLWGFAAITAFMMVYYALFGVFSSLALAANLLFLVALLSLLQATLTLPGIAAIALTLGMAIDANVLINERIREELRGGATPQAAIHAGYERAFGTIIDSNVTTLIAGLALLIFGSGPVRGFAVVHCLGILTSIFSSVVVSRSMVNLFYGSRRRLDKLAIGNTSWT